MSEIYLVGAPTGASDFASFARCFGGRAEDHLAVDEKMDSTKGAHAEATHRIVLHPVYGIYPVEALLGRLIVNADGREVCVRDVAEQHVLEDLGWIPSLCDWLNEVTATPWTMGLRTHRIAIVD